MDWDDLICLEWALQRNFVICLRTQDCTVLLVNLMVQLKSLALRIGTAAPENTEILQSRAVQRCHGYLFH